MFSNNQNNSIIPADCVLLYCANYTKIAYVMTANLDGEKNLKKTYDPSYDKSDVSSTIQEFDEIVHKIQKKDFSCKSKNQKTCDNCDFRHYCSK